MAKPKPIALTEDGVVTQEALLAYTEGRLSETERAEMERLLAADPFAQEAAEGLSTARNLREVPLLITSLNARLREQTGARERRKKTIQIHWSVYAYAALVLGILIGLGFVLIHILSPAYSSYASRSKAAPQTEQTMAKPMPATPKADSAQITALQKATTDSAGRKDSLLAVKQKSDSLTKIAMPGNNNAIALLPAKPVPNVVPAEKKTETKNMNTGAQATGGPGAAPATGSTISAAQGSNTAAAAPATANAPHEVQYDKAADYRKMNLVSHADLPASADAMAALNTAKVYFEKGDYSSASKKYNEVLGTQPNNADALYFGGICDYLNNASGLGESKFDKLSKTSYYSEGTKWYKANILIKKGKKEEARVLLRELINSSGTFKDRAVKQYEDLFIK